MQTFTATYSPEDNKLRLSASSRLDSDLYSRVKSAGFSWAPKQGIFVAGMWTPQREDLLLELCGEIDDEDTTLVDRASDRAERFGGYRENRAADAEQVHSTVRQLADAIPFGQPILVGHHSERRARKDAERIQNGMRKAVRLWETASYWQQRAAGAIRHAKYKERPDVRARRIKTLEADLRRQQNSYTPCPKTKPHTWEGIEHVWVTNGGRSGSWIKTPHLPAIEARAKRWESHLENRLAYERAMLGESGGTVADKNKPEKGGACKCWVGGGAWLEIKKVNKVTVSVADNWGNRGEDFLRTVPFDQLRGVMSKAEFEAAKDSGTVAPTTEGRRAGWRDRVHAEATAQTETKPAPATPSREELERMKKIAAAPVQVVAVPQLFPTPNDLAARMVELADIQPGHRVLEPSAGTGRILGAMGGQMFGHNPERGAVVAVELNVKLADRLRSDFPLTTVHAADFLEQNGNLGKFDRILMNPPFVNGEDIKHIEHAIHFLNPGGRLVAICAGGPRQEGKLRAICESWETLPAGTFKDSGTKVNTILLTIEAAAAVDADAIADEYDVDYVLEVAGESTAHPDRMTRESVQLNLFGGAL